MERRGSECSACADSRTGLCGRCADRLDAQRTKAVASGQVLPRELQRKSHTQTNSIADDDRGSELKCSFCKARRRARELVATELWICSQCDKRTDDKAIRDALFAEMEANGKASQHREKAESGPITEREAKVSLPIARRGGGGRRKRTSPKARKKLTRWCTNCARPRASDIIVCSCGEETTPGGPNKRRGFEETMILRTSTEMRDEMRELGINSSVRRSLIQDEIKRRRALDICL